MECSTSVLFEFLERSVKDSLEISMKNDELPRVECFPDFVVEVPSNKAYGDFSTNAAMVCAKSFKLPPRTIAEILVKNFNFEGSLVKKCEIAGAGFINFFMDDRSTLLYTTKVEENTMPVYQGVYPTKQKTEQYTYRFNGWDPVLAKATKNEN